MNEELELELEILHLELDDIKSDMIFIDLCLTSAKQLLEEYNG